MSNDSDILSAWVDEIRAKLSDPSYSVEALEELRTHLVTLSSGAEVSQKVQVLGLLFILSKLYVEEASISEDLHKPSGPKTISYKHGKEIEYLFDILDLCLPTLPVGYALREARDDLLRALTHPNSNIREVIILEIYRTCKNKLEGFEPDFIDNLAKAIVRSIGDDELKVASKAISILAMHDEWLQKPDVLEEFKGVMEGNSSNRCKCYEVIVNIAKKSPNDLKMCEQYELLQRVTGDLQTEDILLLLNVMEILTNLSGAPHGLKYLVDNGILKFLADMVNKVEVEGTSNLITPGLMKFFGNLCHRYPSEVLTSLQESYPNVVEALFTILKTFNPVLTPVALDTLGFIGSTVEGKLALAALGHIFTSSVSEVGVYIKNSPTEVRIRALQCIASLISVKNDIPETSEFINGHVDQRVMLMTREWFRSLSKSPSSMELLFGLCKNPFPDLKLAGLSLLFSVIEHNWGKELVKETPGMIEYLLDRSVEHNKEAKHAKYEIIASLSMSSVFDVSVILRLKNYVDEGPFYVQGLTEVAIEGD